MSPYFSARLIRATIILPLLIHTVLAPVAVVSPPHRLPETHRLPLSPSSEPVPPAFQSPLS
ncbi:MAG: hypothetical protein ACPL7C_00680, partial [Anaerolineae bacterium]